MTNNLAHTLAHGAGTGEISKLRLYAMKFIYLATFLFLGSMAWREIVNHQGSWDPLHGVAYSFWAAYATLMLLGLIHPLKMLPLLILQLFYKSVWILAIALPLWSAGNLDPGTADWLRRFSFAVGVDLIVIPWPYVWSNYLRKAPIQ